MKINAHKHIQIRAVALVITLLMLSVITFLAIAFLAMTSRDKNAVSASLDQDTARSMSDTALARVQTEITAQMMGAKDVLSYDYMASHNYISQAGFFPGNTYFTNINYDFINGVGPYNSFTQPLAWAQNIGNLFYDPRPPVFVPTNGSVTSPLNDFRFWVDINRNGRFETNGPVQVIDQNGNPILGVTNWVNGEPEWIGVLKYPEYVHSPTNPFIGRYAYMALPIGKTLDLNYINNHSRYATNGGDSKMASDGFIRDQGVGAWELNLAALIDNLSPEFQTNPLYNNYAANPYIYVPSIIAGVLPFAAVNYDASQFLGFRFGTNTKNMQTLVNFYGNPALTAIGLNGIDEYGAYNGYPSTTIPFDYTYNGPLAAATTLPWPGSYNMNQFYDVQDLFDSTKSDASFVANLAYAVAQPDTINRYTFQRLLGCIGTSSSPEYGVYVHDSLGNLILTNKVNINYDNTAQIQAGPYASMPTNLVPWTPIGFFTNAADLLLRSQPFVFTNYVFNAALNQYVPAIAPQPLTITNYFSLTNIVVYSASQPGIVYNEQVHRMLQLAANIYADAYSNTLPVNLVPHPPVFRPQFSILRDSSGKSNVLVTITNFVQVTNNGYSQITSGKGFFELTNAAAFGLADNQFNFWGIPWVVAAVKGIPTFNQYSYNNQVYYARQLQFVRFPDASNPGKYKVAPPFQYTNQFYEISVSNIFGMDIWNPYSTYFASANGLYVVAYSHNTVIVSNSVGWTTNYDADYRTYVTSPTNIAGPNIPWRGWQNVAAQKLNIGQFKTLLQTNFITLQTGYYSDSLNQFITNDIHNSVRIQPGDTNQTKYQTHSWFVTVTNHVYYALFDGNPVSGARLLDFVNLGPFGSSFPVTQYLTNFDTNATMWIIPPATDAGNGQISQGVINQINFAENNDSTFLANMTGGPGCTSASTSTFAAPGPAPTGVEAQAGTVAPYANYADSNIWMASDPLVHYTLGDLFVPASSKTMPSSQIVNLGAQNPFLISGQMGLSIGTVTKRYTQGAANGNGAGVMLYGDPLIASPDAWQFPTNLFPSVGWLGRVHRGTPWQTIYLKSDSPAQAAGWSALQTGNTPWVNSPYTYPTNDWSLIDLFTTVPNDNAARGLLSVNQTNDAAWAAVFAGVIALTGPTTGVPISPTNDSYNFYNLAVDGPAGMNAVRAASVNGLFHHVGDILQVPALTVSSPYTTSIPATELTDEMVERIPQQTLSLLKVGLPQFVVYCWGQSLKPKSMYTAAAAPAYLNNICTNYEITGEYLTRTVCHVVSTDGTAASPKIIVDNYNIEPEN
jgi:hypothetical protein